LAAASSHAEILGLSLQHGAAKLVRVLAGGVRQFVDEALPHERVCEWNTVRMKPTGTWLFLIANSILRFGTS